MGCKYITVTLVVMLGNFYLYSCRAFGMPVSLRNRDRMRTIRGFEKKAVAKARTIKENQMIKTVSATNILLKYCIFK